MEIKAREFKEESFLKTFLDKKIEEIAETVGDNIAINALSGGVDSSAVTVLGHKALGKKLKTYLIDNGLMRQDEPQWVASLFNNMGIHVEIIDAGKEFFQALRDITDPEAKREAVTQTFYKDVFGRLVRESGAKYLLQGTNLTDAEETSAGFKRQHNVFEQIGIDPEKVFGYKIIEPLVQLRKDGIRIVAQALNLPESIYNRPPFPGPSLATRIIGAVTVEKIKLVRQATVIMEEVLKPFKAFQSMAILHEDRVTGIVGGKREFGLQIEIRCWNSIDARTATPIRLSWKVLDTLGERIPAEVSGVVQATYNITKKPPVTMEAL